MALEDGFAEAIQMLMDEREIRKVIMTYARGSDRKDFDLMRSAYHSDGFDNHGSIRARRDEFLKWCEPHHEKFDAAMHLLGYPNIDLQGDVAFAETYGLVMHWLKPVPPMPAMTATIACRYVDRFERRDGAWKIAHRVVVYESVKREFMEEFAPHPIGGDFETGRRSREDIVYRMPGLSQPGPD